MIEPIVRRESAPDHRAGFWQDLEASMTAPTEANDRFDHVGSPASRDRREARARCNRLPTVPGLRSSKTATSS